jgi:G3E family GTPase
MQLFIVSGFLGSGKTTFIIQFARAAIERKIKVAILVNEIGEIGIDDQYMRRLGLNVWEMLGGCICCTLAADLGSTLDKLLEEYQTDLVLLEPSGAADPKSIDKIIGMYENRDLLKIRKLTIVDPLRFSMMLEVLTPLITSQIQSAEWVLINKEDVAPPEDLENTRLKVAGLHPQAGIICTSVKQKLDLAILEELLPWRG